MFRVLLAAADVDLVDLVEQGTCRIGALRLLTRVDDLAGRQFESLQITIRMLAGGSAYSVQVPVKGQPHGLIVSAAPTCGAADRPRHRERLRLRLR